MSPKHKRMAQTQVESQPSLSVLGNNSQRRLDGVSTLSDLDLERTLSSLQLRDHELARLHNYNRRCHTEELEARDLAKAREHDHALEAVKRERDSIRAEAEAALRQYLIQEEEERRRQQEEERLRRQREAEEKAERDRQLLEEAERIEKLRKAREAAEAQRAAEREAKARAEAEAEADRKRKEELEKKLHEERESAARAESERKTAEARSEQQAVEAAAKATASALAASPEVETRHREYLDLYQRIKKFKNDYRDELKTFSKEHRTPIGDARRDIRSGLGKLSADKKGNELIRQKTEGLIQAALANTTTAGRPVPVNYFLPKYLTLHDGDRKTISAAAGYLLAVFVQEAVKLFTQFAHGEAERADPIGTCVAALFAMPALQFEREGGDQPQKANLFPILLAKYHKVCPVLFGITGDQSKQSGKVRLGWQVTAGPKDRDGAKTALVTDNTHSDRMKGLAFGYASFALRNFSRSKNTNPYPPINFWETLALINNLDSTDIQPTHLYVLRHIFGHNGLERFFLFFGAPGVAAVREAFVNLPRRLPPNMQSNPETIALGQFVDENLAKKLHFHLT